MSQPPRTILWVVWGGLVVVMLAILAASVARQFKGAPLPVLSTLNGFTLTNQNGRAVTLDDFRGQVWIADAIFTRCPSQCLVLSGHMKDIQAALPSDAPIQLVSFTTDPAFDQPAVLKKYAEHFGAREGCWSFLTGDKTALKNVEIDGLKLPVLDKPAAEQEGANDLFIHSQKFVLLDKAGRIRAWYDGENPDTVAQVIAAAKRLVRE